MPDPELLLFATIAVLCLSAIWFTNKYDRRARDETFMRQCAESGYNQTRCRFWLTVTDGETSGLPVTLEGAR